ELESTSSATEALRAQAHEFANRMHTVVGLLELGEYDAAIEFITSTTPGLRAGELRERVNDPTLAALLLAKSAEAAERGARLVLSEDSAVPEGALGDPQDAGLVVGHPLANAREGRKSVARGRRRDARGVP